MERIINYTTQNDGYKYNSALKPQGVMIHSTATPGIMAKAFRDRFNKPGLGKSVHGFIDDTCYVQCLPYDKKAGHARYSANDTHIGIEMCEPKGWTSDKAYFEKVYKNMVEITAEICKQYNIAVTPASVLSHAEGYKMGIASNHSDVGHWWPFFNRTMDGFRANVIAKMSETPEKEIVKDLQEALNSSYNSGLVADGIAGTKTQAAVKLNSLAYKQGKKPTRNKYVRWVQTRLESKGIDCGGVDGAYGAKTKAAVIAFQKENGLAMDGIVGIKTTMALIK